MTLKAFAVGILLIPLIIPAACGFKLRGSYSLPAIMQLTYLKANQPYSEMTRALKRYLKASGVKVQDEAIGEAAVLDIMENSVQRRVLSVDERGRAREYEINYRVTFSLIHNAYDGAILEQHLELERDYLFDPENALAADAEERLLLRSMAHEMARLIMTRLAVADQSQRSR